MNNDTGPSQLRSLAQAYADGRIERDDYLRERTAFLDALGSQGPRRTDPMQAPTSSSAPADGLYQGASSPPSPAQGGRRTTLLIGVGVGLTVLIGAGAALWLLGGDTAGPQTPERIAEDPDTAPSAAPPRPRPETPAPDQGAKAAKLMADDIDTFLDEANWGAAGVLARAQLIEQWQGVAADTRERVRNTPAFQRLERELTETIEIERDLGKDDNELAALLTFGSSLGFDLGRSPTDGPQSASPETQRCPSGEDCPPVRDPVTITELAGDSDVIELADDDAGALAEPAAVAAEPDPEPVESTMTINGVSDCLATPSAPGCASETQDAEEGEQQAPSDESAGIAAGTAGSTTRPAPSEAQVIQPPPEVISAIDQTPAMAPVAEMEPTQADTADDQPRVVGEEPSADTTTIPSAYRPAPPPEREPEPEPGAADAPTIPATFTIPAGMVSNTPILPADTARASTDSAATPGARVVADAQANEPARPAVPREPLATRLPATDRSDACVRSVTRLTNLKTPTLGCRDSFLRSARSKGPGLVVIPGSQAPFALTAKPPSLATLQDWWCSRQFIPCGNAAPGRARGPNDTQLRAQQPVDIPDDARALAVDYARWLSDRTGYSYRIATETELSEAARHGVSIGSGTSLFRQLTLKTGSAEAKALERWWHFQLTGSN